MAQEVKFHIRPAVAADREDMIVFHVENHLAETAHYPGERESQMEDLPNDFPQLYDEAVFATEHFFLGFADSVEGIAGCVGIIPDTEERGVCWMNTFSVAKSMRGRGLGRDLLLKALDTARHQGYTTVRLVTLGEHSEQQPVMAKARALYEQNGFVMVRKKQIAFGTHTTVFLMWYSRSLE
jgi:GNAT superfamily N-acetyltransferase